MTKQPSSEQPRAAGRRRAAGSSARRQDIINTAAELFATRGYKATTVREIGEAAGVLSGSLYHHFDSKETILDELMSGYLDEVEARYREVVEGEHDPEEALRLLISTAFSSLHTHRAAVTVIQNEREYLDELPRFAYLREAEERAQQLWVSVIQEGIDSGIFREEIDADTAYRFIRDAVWVSVRWFRAEGALTEQQLADQYLLVILHGLLGSAAEGRRGKSRSGAAAGKGAADGATPAAKPAKKAARKKPAADSASAQKPKKTSTARARKTTSSRTAD